MYSYRTLTQIFVLAFPGTPQGYGSALQNKPAHLPSLSDPFSDVHHENRNFYSRNTLETKIFEYFL